MIRDKPPLDESLLAHFGIKGMRWGFRKQKPLSTESRTISKGTKIQTVTAGKSAVAGDRRMFVSHTPKDNLAYRGTYARVLRSMTKDPLYTNTLTVTKPLKVASEKTAFDEFRKMYDADPKGMTLSIAKSHEALTRLMLGMGDVPDQQIVSSTAKRYGKKGEAWVNKQGYELFVTAAGTDVLSRDVADKYYTSLSRAGYDAIVDITDKKAKMADDPIVILHPKKSVTVNNTVPLTKDDIKLARQHYKELKKQST